MNSWSGNSTHVLRKGAYLLLTLVLGAELLSSCGGSSNTAAPTLVTEEASTAVATPKPVGTSAGSPATSQMSARSPEPATSLGPLAQVGVSCRSSDLALAVGNRISEPTGQHTLSLTLTNRSNRPCSLLGYPKVILFDDAGRELPFEVQQRGDQVVTADAPTLVDVAPGDMAYVTLNKYRCDLGDRAMASRLELFLPGAATPLQLKLPTQVSAMSFGYCGPGDPGSIVASSPFAATFAETVTH